MPGDRVTTGGFMFSLLTCVSPLAMVSVLSPAALVASAQAQVQNVAPYHAFVTVDKATVRCGDNDRFYKVGELASGQVVLVDGEGGSWSRIAYPSNLFAFVKVEDVKVEGSTATLTTQSKLKAANVTAGFTSSWKSLLDTPLSAGTQLRVIESFKEGDSVIGYRVEPPQAARAFVESRVLRHATEAEVAAWKSKSGAVATTPSPTSPTTPPSPTTTTPTTTAATPVTPGTTPAQPLAVKPVDDSAPVVDLSLQQEPIKRVERPVGSIEALEDRFKAVWKQEQISAEVGELLSEYKRALEATPSENVARRRGLTSRVNALQTRLDINNLIREQEEAKAKLDGAKVELARQLEDWDRSRVYTIVGELRPSTVYDGKSLPQMYRVVSIGGAAARTLGYLKPTPEINLDKMLGQVVGVIGEASMDRSLKLNIISPVKVEVLRSAPETSEPTTSGATATVPDVQPEK
jgi:hypothetical protein